MEDIAPQLLETLRTRFSEKISANPKIRALEKKIEAGLATYVDAEDYSYLIGKALSEVFQDNLSSAVLPDGRMYFNIAQRVLQPLLQEDYDIVTKAATTVQTFLNQKAGIGIMAQTAPINEDRIYGIVNKVAEAEFFDDVKWVLDAPVVNYSMNVVDEILRSNVEFQGRAGLNPKVIRKAERNCCQWCSNLAGAYDYPVDRTVYQRHERCRCTTDYDPGDGRRQNVYTRQWTTSTAGAMLESLQVVGLKTGDTVVRGMSVHAIGRIKERNVTMDAIKDALANPLDRSGVKLDSEGRPSVRIIGAKATVSINPDTGFITTVYPTHSKTARKLKERK